MSKSKHRMQARARRAAETPEQREARLEQMRDRIASETPQQREARLNACVSVMLNQSRPSTVSFALTLISSPHQSCVYVVVHVCSIVGMIFAPHLLLISNLTHK